ncbi:MAG: ATP-dependent DNA helicase RecG [Nitrospinales bacterium]
MKVRSKHISPRSLDDPIRFIKGVGPKRATLLQKRNLFTVRDCLYFLPYRYEDRSHMQKISQLVAGEQATFTGTVVNAGSFSAGSRRKIFEMIIQDDSGVIRAKWFRFNEPYLREKFKPRSTVIVSGKPGINRYGGSGLEIIHPNIEIFSSGDDPSLEMGRIVPVYHSTEGLHAKSLRTIFKYVIDHYCDLIEEILPDDILRRNRMMPRQKAVAEAHLPPNGTSLTRLQNFTSPAQQRIIFDELFLIQLGLAFKRKHRTKQTRGHSFKTRGPTIKKFVKRLRFELTRAQKKVLNQIMNDLEKDTPMNRLLQGDVGSGKTIVALITLLTGVDNGYQGALMAPTELLAEQHFLNLQADCQALGVGIELITSGIKGKTQILNDIHAGKTAIIVGTHALIQKQVRFHNLGVAVIDEQHRFGVLQREALARKGLHPHTLVMTATPIPRSLALTLYGDLDVSIIDELPPGRMPIDTKLSFGNKRHEVYESVRRGIYEGRQAYVVCPLIEETETLDLQTAVEVREDLASLFPGLTVGLIHGKIKPDERSRIMSRFKAGDIHILVSTTVIEVGIDVPNATVMIIEHAERFGLSQLHQLRGRVGRGGHSSQCLLIAYYPLTDEAKARLQAMLKTGDGFRIAEEDMNIRGPGDFMGTRQSGLPELQVADLVRDIRILEVARKEAFALIERDPNLQDHGNHKLKDDFRRFMGNRLDLMDII